MKDSQRRPEKGGITTQFLLVLILVCVVGLLYWLVTKRQAAAQMAGAERTALPPVPVLAAKAVKKNVPVYLDGLGTAQAFNAVTLVSRVDGQLKKIAAAEGQDVRAGDVLAQIDPDPYQAALDQAKARKKQDEAMLENAQIQLKRETELLAAKIDSQETYDSNKAQVDTLLASVNADQAAIDSAQVQLDYTTITAPIDGRVGIRLVDQGNVVHAADTNGLFVITQLKPIAVIFTLPEQNLAEINSRQSPDHPLKVLAVGADNKTVLDEGTLSVVDNQIDSTTGTIKLKAVFPNEKLKLWPGQFVNIRLLINVRQNGLVVPATAIQRGPDGAFVFVVGKNDDPPKDDKPAAQTNSAPPGRTNGPPLMVKIRPVKVSSRIEAGEMLVESGLEADEMVVTDGQYKLQDGSPVRIVSKPSALLENADATPAAP
jgi:multidrug efflux system membrane fusion protein